MAEKFKGQRPPGTHSWCVIALKLTPADLSLNTGVPITSFYHIFCLKTLHTGVFTDSFNKYPLNTNCVLGTLLGTGAKTVNKPDTAPALLQLGRVGVRRSKQTTVTDTE